MTQAPPRGPPQPLHVGVRIPKGIWGGHRRSGRSGQSRSPRDIEQVGRRPALSRSPRAPGASVGGAFVSVVTRRLQVPWDLVPLRLAQGPVRPAALAMQLPSSLQAAAGGHAGPRHPHSCSPPDVGSGGRRALPAPQACPARCSAVRSPPPRPHRAPGAAGGREDWPRCLGLGAVASQALGSLLCSHDLTRFFKLSPRGLGDDVGGREVWGP